MRDNRTYLKVKIKSLTVEARIIRAEERRATRPDLRNGLRDHRRHEVRAAARNTHLAYAFLRGRAYHDVERGAMSSPDWKEITRMVDRYGVQWSPECMGKAHAEAKADQSARLKVWLEPSSRTALESARTVVTS